jgi:hypothetical protein
MCQGEPGIACVKFDLAPVKTKPASHVQCRNEKDFAASGEQIHTESVMSAAAVCKVANVPNRKELRF